VITTAARTHIILRIWLLLELQSGFVPSLHRQGVEPEEPILHLNDRHSTRLEHRAAPLDQPLRVRAVLRDAVCVDEIDCSLG
jgi:hypothetical protein